MKPIPEKTMAKKILAVHILDLHWRLLGAISFDHSDRKDGLKSP
jgi:hypothetical protein